MEIAIGLIILSVSALGILTKLYSSKNKESKELAAENKELKRKYAPELKLDSSIQEKESRLDKLHQMLKELEDKYNQALGVYNGLSREINLYKDELETFSYGLYEPIFNYQTSEVYKTKIEKNRQKQKTLIKNDRAVTCTTKWEVSGSAKEGEKMTKQYMKLMLRAFNGDCDSLVTKVNWNNEKKIEERIVKCFDAVNKLGEKHHTFIEREYLNLKLEELKLTYEYQLKQYEEKEEQREIKERIREEEKALKEMEKAQKEAEKEEERYMKALEKARADIQKVEGAKMDKFKLKIQELEEQLRKAQEMKERAKSMAQMTKTGYVYVISNIGAFGENVYKIGMTRRLEPMDRVKELSSASVPFEFDVHAMIYSDNAPQLEKTLHNALDQKRLNLINKRKEFFRVNLNDVQRIVEKNHGSIEFTKLAEARDYRESVYLLEKMNNSRQQTNPQPVGGSSRNFPSSLFAGS